MWFTELSGQRERKHGLITTCSNGQFYVVPKQHCTVDSNWQSVWLGIGPVQFQQLGTRVPGTFTPTGVRGATETSVA